MFEVGDKVRIMVAKVPNTEIDVPPDSIGIILRLTTQADPSFRYEIDYPNSQFKDYHHIALKSQKRLVVWRTRH
jgi:hypothetical protein